MLGDIGHIIVIESLEGERQTGTELYKDCILRNIGLRRSSITTRFFSAATRTHLADALQYCAVNAPYMPGGILIHLETHGDADREGLVLADNTLVAWGDLIDLFRPINVASCNNLYVSVAACEGRYLYLGVDSGKKSPYSSFISASVQVYSSQIVNEFTRLFEYLIEHGNLVDATLYMQEQGSKFFYKDSRTTFEESFIVTADKMRHDPAIRKEIIEKTRIETAKQGVPAPPDASFDWIVELAVKEAYKTRKKAFEFSGC